MPGVEVIGTVPDVRPWVDRAAVAVVPLRIARGVQNKILEAMAMTRRVVASPTCLGGVSAIPGKHLLEATTPREWETKLLELFDDAQQRQRLGEAGRGFVEEHHCWERCLEPLGKLLLPPA
jgi:glycosyltransferase involved in cell wall biosynthesis